MVTMTLWILFCRMSRLADILFPFYAYDRDDAEVRAEEIVAQFGYERLDLKEYRHGFTIMHTSLPGVIEGDAV